MATQQQLAYLPPSLVELRLSHTGFDTAKIAAITASALKPWKSHRGNAPVKLSKGADRHMFPASLQSALTRVAARLSAPFSMRTSTFNDPAKLVAALASIFILSFSFYSALALPIDRSFWYDEFHIAWRLSEYCFLEVLTNSFRDNIGRMPGYMLVNELISSLHNAPWLLRAMNFLVYFATIGLLAKLALRCGVYFLLTLCLIVFLSDDYVRMLAIFKPYTWDTLAILTCVYCFVQLRPDEPKTHWNAFLFITIASTFTHIAWPLMATLAAWKAWNLGTSARSLGAVIGNLRSELVQHRIHAICIVLIWVYLLQYIARYFLGDDSIFFSYVAVEQSTAPEGAFDAFTQFFRSVHDILAQFGSLSVSSDMPFKFMTLEDSAVGYILALGFFSAIWIGGRTIALIAASIVLSYIVSLFGDWPFDDERWSMAVVVLFATPIGFALERLAVQHRIAASVLLYGFLLVQAPIRQNTDGRAFYNSAYQYSRLHPSTSTVEALRWLDERADNDVIEVFSNVNSLLGYDYYVHHAAIDSFQELQRLRHRITTNPTSLQARIAEAEGTVFALFHFHRVSVIEEQVNFIETHCTVIDHLEPEDRLGDHRVLRVEIVLFRCDS